MDMTSFNSFSESVEKQIDYELAINHYNNLHGYIESNICSIGYSPEVFCEDYHTKDIFQKVSDTFNNIIEIILRFFKTIWVKFRNWIVSLFSAKRKEILKNINEKVGTLIKEIEDKLKGVKAEDFKPKQFTGELDKGLENVYGTNPIVKNLQNMILAINDSSLARFKRSLADFKVNIEHPSFVKLFKTPADYFGALARFHKMIFDHTMAILKYDKSKKFSIEKRQSLLVLELPEERRQSALDALSRIIKNLKIDIKKDEKLTKEDASENRLEKVDLPTIEELDMYEKNIKSIKKCYPLANNMFNSIARFYNEKEPNDIKWEPLDDLKELKDRQESYEISKTIIDENSDIFVKRIASTILIKNQTAISKSILIGKKIDKFLMDVAKTIEAIKNSL